MKFQIFEAIEPKFPFTYHSSVDVYRHMEAYKRADREVFIVMLFNGAHRLLDCQPLFVGSVNSASVYPREVLKAAININASAVILLHNHPAGSMTPSKEDDRITKQIMYGLRFFDIQVLDHIIIATEGYYSYADSGLIEDYMDRAKADAERWGIK